MFWPVAIFSFKDCGLNEKRALCFLIIIIIALQKSDVANILLETFFYSFNNKAGG